MVTKKLLADFTLECGHRFQMWSEVAADNSWSLHFHAPCPDAEKLARQIAEAKFPGKAVTVEG